MSRVLTPLAHSTPPVLTYLDKGLGASILKAGLRLWDRSSVNPVAVIKVARHNLLRPTAILHEAGHQLAHIVGWTEQLRTALRVSLAGSLGRVWSSWASEIAADACAFVHAGYASVAALRNVVDGGRRIVFRFFPGDPHPIAFLRVLLGVEMCRRMYGSGPWDELDAVWRHRYPLSAAPTDIQSLLRSSVKTLGTVVDVTIRQRYRAYGGRSLIEMVDPAEVSPRALDALERAAGPRLFSSPYVVSRDALRLLALSGYRFATIPEEGHRILAQQLESMLVLGRARRAA